MKKSIFFVSAIVLSAVFGINSSQATTCALETENAYRASDSKSIYYITENCTKRPFRKSSVFFTYFDSWNDVQVVQPSRLESMENDPLGFMPKGPKYGALVKTLDDPKVYLLLGNKKKWITDENGSNPEVYFKIPIHGVLVLVVTDNFSYVFSFESDLVGYEEDLELFNKMLDSITFLN